VEVFTKRDVDGEVILGVREDRVRDDVEIGTADMILLLMEIAGAEEVRWKR
jgi:hypothetical protein